MSKSLDNKVKNEIAPLIQGDARRYYNKYVAFASFNDKKIDLG